MLILITTALVAVQPAPAFIDSQGHHMAMAETGKHEQMTCCDCCKAMAKKHEGHAEHHGHAGQ